VRQPKLVRAKSGRLMYHVTDSQFYSVNRYLKIRPGGKGISNTQPCRTDVTRQDKTRQDKIRLYISQRRFKTNILFCYDFLLRDYDDFNPITIIQQIPLRFTLNGPRLVRSIALVCFTLPSTHRRSLLRLAIVAKEPRATPITIFEAS
jgi:hypothetical protein